MTELATHSYANGVESLTLTINHDDETPDSQIAGKKPWHAKSPAFGNAMPNGDPPTAMLWGDDE